MAREYRRTCRRCGKIWHSLVSRENKIKRDKNCTQCDIAGSGCNPSARMQAKRNLQASESDIGRLRRCPNCQSSSYDEEIVS